MVYCGEDFIVYGRENFSSVKVLSYTLMDVRCPGRKWNQLYIFKFTVLPQQ